MHKKAVIDMSKASHHDLVVLSKIIVQMSKALAPHGRSIRVRRHKISPAVLPKDKASY